MTGKNVKERIGLGGMDADRIREIMGKRLPVPGRDVERPVTTLYVPQGKMAPCNRPSTGRNTCMALRACSVGRCIFPPPCTGNCPSWREPRETERSLWRVHQPPCLAASGRIQGNDGHDSGGVPARPGHKGSSPMTGDLPDGSIIFVSETIVFNF